MPIEVTLDCNQQIVDITGVSEKTLTAPQKWRASHKDKYNALQRAYANISSVSEKTGVTADDICENSLEYYKRTLPYGEMCIKHVVGCDVKKQCATCTYDTFAMQPSMKIMTRRRIHSIGIRQPSNMRTSRIASLNTHDCNNVCAPQNNLSDRATPSVSVARVKRNGSSTRRTQTANRPGAMTPGGIGVDQKHGSYERYLNAKKGRLLRAANPNTAAQPMLTDFIQQPTYM
jgi:hypothetical protein